MAKAYPRGLPLSRTSAKSFTHAQLHHWMKPMDCVLNLICILSFNQESMVRPRSAVRGVGVAFSALHRLNAA
jgi:hypothetical protein